MGIGALFEHENHRGTGLKLIADRFLLLIVRKMLDVTQDTMPADRLGRLKIIPKHCRFWRLQNAKKHCDRIILRYLLFINNKL